ncbi:hypothetical protein NVP2275O_467 [Vibrio phage 2.275.O._10N.286.54.E11]|nr:hypothetical protein NVP2275O_467 [Vibrio phage 2.275.O._10N.286.54.E11]
MEQNWLNLIKDEELDLSENANTVRYYNRKKAATGCGFKGKRHTKEYCETMSANRTGTQNPMYGREQTDDGLAALQKGWDSENSINKRGCTDEELCKAVWGRAKGWFLTPKGSFISSQLAAEINDVPDYTIRKWCHNRYDKSNSRTILPEDENLWGFKPK